MRTVGVESIEDLPPLPEIAGSDAALQLQKQVDALKAAEEARAAAEEEADNA